MYCSYLYIRHKYKRWDKKKRKENCVASVCIYCGFYCEAYLSEMKRMDAR
jgi:hypothetical protein